MRIENFSNELLVSICEYLPDADKMSFMLSCKTIMNIGYFLLFNNKVNYEKIKKSRFKYNFTSVVFDEEEDDMINFKYLKKLTYNGCIFRNKNCIPRSVTHLIFGPYFNQDIKDLIHEGVTHLILGDMFNSGIYGCLPNSLIHLKFGASFNQDVYECLPSSLIYLEFGNNFNCDVYGCFPPSLKHLKFGNDFNKEIKDCIPPFLIHLELGNSFNRIIKDKIPDSVKHLKLGRCFKQKIEIPPPVTHLTVYKSKNIRNNVPKTVIFLKILN